MLTFRWFEGDAKAKKRFGTVWNGFQGSCVLPETVGTVSEMISFYVQKRFGTVWNGFRL